MDDLCEQLALWSNRWVGVDDWPDDALRLCGRAGVLRWFLKPDDGGFGWSEQDQVRGYLRLAEVDLTTTFVITQYVGAIRRIVSSRNRFTAERWTEKLVSGEALTTVGISHLTTSRRHLSKPVLEARANGSGYRFSGIAPWVTGVPHADIYVLGATLDDGLEVLAAVPADAPGLMPGRGVELTALSASCTDQLRLDNVEVCEQWLLAGPVEHVMQTGSGGSTGGLQTSTLAIGLARAAVQYLRRESELRPEILAAAGELTHELEQQEARLLTAAGGDASCDVGEIRTDANRLALRATQAALTAAKGTGYLIDHPVGRWCREALFFLVWSCPQPIQQAHLCEFAGIQ